jgi:outer membrane protein assembly factor BamB
MASSIKDRIMKLGTLLGLLLAAATTALSAENSGPATQPAKADVATDWPQYRGPTRDGIAPAGPKLLDTWPKEGPKLLWKSEPLWPGKGVKSGCGSIAVAGGRAFVFAYVTRKVGKVVIHSADLIEAGWVEGVPDDLAKKVEDARTSPANPRWNKQGAEQAACIKEFIAGLDPEQARKYGPWIQRRLTWTGHPVNNGMLSWATLTKLAAVVDQEFASFEELEKRLGGAWGWQRGTGNSLDVTLTNRAISFLDTIICLDASSGKEIWRKEFPGAPVHYDEGLFTWVGASSTPTVADGMCYVTGSAGFYCLSAKDGATVWQAKTKFSNSSPLVVNGVVYVTTPEAAAYDAKTGQVLWCQPELKIVNSSFVPWTSGGKNRLLITANGGTYSRPQGATYCLDPANGKELWRAGGSAFSTPVLAGADTMVVNGGQTTAFKITPAKTERLWGTPNAGDPRGAGPLVYQDHVYLAGSCHSGGALSCLDLKTGEKKWNPHTFCAESSSPVLTDGKIIAAIEEDEGSFYILMYRAAPEKFEELGRFNPHMVAGDSPAIVGGKMYLRLQDCIACYDLTASAK